MVIPAGLGAGEGTYVRYDHEAMIGVLALEAHRAGAVIIGEDLGLVEPWVRDYLSGGGFSARACSGSSRRTAVRARRSAGVVSCWRPVNTHDLPPTAGYLADEHVALRARLGLLTRPVEDELRDAAAEREAMLAVLRERGLIGASTGTAVGDGGSVVGGGGEEEIIEALHVLITASPSLLLGVSLVDAVGERRVQNSARNRVRVPELADPARRLGG